MLNISYPHILLPGIDQEALLVSMGLSTEAITESISDGLTQFKRATELHPVTHAGITAWGEINATLRAILKSEAIGWDCTHKSGLTITYNKEFSIALIATSGDKDTGLEAGDPCTKNKKGPSTRNIVASNMMGDLFDDGSETPLIQKQSQSIDPTKTWILLYHFDKMLKEIRFELSLPASTARICGKDNKLKIDSWKWRLLFSPMSFENVPVEPAEEIPFSEEITFEVSKKHKP